MIVFFLHLNWLYFDRFWNLLPLSKNPFNTISFKLSWIILIQLHLKSHNFISICLFSSLQKKVFIFSWSEVSDRMLNVLTFKNPCFIYACSSFTDELINFETFPPYYPAVAIFQAVMIRTTAEYIANKFFFICRKCNYRTLCKGQAMARLYYQPCLALPTVALFLCCLFCSLIQTDLVHASYFLLFIFDAIF